MLKRCTSCPEDDQWHPATLDYFYKDRTKTDKLTTQCRRCKCNKSREYSASHKEEKKDKDREYYFLHREAKLTYRRDYHATHREEENAKSSVYQQEHHEEISVRNHNWYVANREDEIVKRLIYAAEHRIEAIIRVRAWRQADPERTRAKRRVETHRRRALQHSIPGTHTPAQIQEQLKRQKYRCYYAACGFSKFPEINGKYIYEVDHTFPISRVAGTNIPANDMSYLVLSCKRCNQRKSNKFPWEFFEGGRLL